MRPAVKAPRRPGAPPGRRTRPGKAAWAGLLLLAAAMPAGARVFQFGGRGDTDPVRAVSAAEHPVYQTTLQLNGGSGAVDVRACPGSVSAVLERLMGAYREQGALAFGLSGEQLGWGVVLYNGRVIRLLAASAGRRNSCLLFRFDQSERDFSRSAEAAPAWPPGLPAYPGSRLTRLLCNEATGTRVACSTAMADGGDVQRYFHRALSEAGWAGALGPQDEASGVYLKGPELLCVTVLSAGIPGQCVITLLHRRLKAKPDA